MKRSLFSAALLMTLAAPAFAGSPSTRAEDGNVTIVVSCYRGPWKEVIWDRPNPAFIESLVAVGYDYANARAVGETVCGDAALVNNPEGLRATMRRIYADTASERRRTR